jgi:hypothetical protein
VGVLQTGAKVGPRRSTLPAITAYEPATIQGGRIIRAQCQCVCEVRVSAIQIVLRIIRQPPAKIDVDARLFERNGAAVIGDRSIEIATLVIGIAPPGMGIGKIKVERQRLREIRERLVDRPLVVTHAPTIIIRFREIRLRRDRMGIIHDRLRAITFVVIGRPAIVVDRCRIWSQRKRLRNVSAGAIRITPRNRPARGPDTRQRSPAEGTGPVYATMELSRACR